MTTTPPSLCTGSWPPGAKKPVSDDGVETLVAVVVGNVDVVGGVDVVAVIITRLSVADGSGATIANCSCCCCVDVLIMGPTVNTYFYECIGTIKNTHG